MYEVIFAYNFENLKGKPQREVEKISGCKIKCYGVIKDSVTLFILCSDEFSLSKCVDVFKDKFNLKPIKIKKII
jgi:hypothetical protein